MSDAITSAAAPGEGTAAASPSPGRPAGGTSPGRGSAPPTPGRRASDEQTAAGVLAGLRGPEDLKALPAARLPELAAEIRRRIIDTVSRTGGHLAPNLGVVELTIALHRVFSSPRDRIIWDVGHQTYAHKLLTGRAERFNTLRQENGLSGFPRRSESPHDVFETGHASTSVSAALGIAAARDLKRDDYSVVAVIGDGALTGGMAFEALNNAGHMKTHLIVVLNDNELSYGPTVGGLASHLSRLRSHPVYFRVRRDLESFVKNLPLIGPALYYLGGRIKGSVKYLVVPGILFEELGFTYLGPVDGHNLAQLEEFLERAKMIRGPAFVHVITKKGKGYPPAEADPDRFHGIGPFDIATGFDLAEPPITGPNGPSTAVNNHGPSSALNSHALPRPTYTQVFGQTLLELGSRDDRIVAITAAMASSTGVLPFARSFPKRWFDVGISEQHAVTFAAGLAAEGLRPVVAVYSTFLQRAYDQILHDVCLQRLPVTFVLDRGGLVGADGPTHHGAYDLSYLRAMPGMVVMAPKDENELRHMLKTALYLGGPAAVRYPRGPGPGTRAEGEPRRLEVGRAEILRDGGDLAIVAIGSMVVPSLEAAERLGSAGLRAAVVNARFAAPVDGNLIVRLARETGRILTVEENVAKGGFGAAVVETLTGAGLTVGVKGVRVRRLALPDEPVEHGRAETLRRRYGLDAEGIARAAAALVRDEGGAVDGGRRG
ncbi:MAG: 1-deoxy-D-xylulose-5-phosphate synthase [Bacillota bacterium]